VRETAQGSRLGKGGKEQEGRKEGEERRKSNKQLWEPLERLWLAPGT
jgi:hypothetical protein